MTKKELHNLRAGANEMLNNISAYIDVHLGKITDATRAWLTDDAERAFNEYFAAAKASGRPMNSVTPRFAAERYVIGCINKPRK